MRRCLVSVARRLRRDDGLARLAQLFVERGPPTFLRCARPPPPRYGRLHRVGGTPRFRKALGERLWGIATARCVLNRERYRKPRSSSRAVRPHRALPPPRPGNAATPGTSHAARPGDRRTTGPTIGGRSGHAGLRDSSFLPQASGAASQGRPLPDGAAVRYVHGAVRPRRRLHWRGQWSGAAKPSPCQMPTEPSWSGDRIRCAGAQTATVDGGSPVGGEDSLPVPRRSGAATTHKPGGLAERRQRLRVVAFVSGLMRAVTGTSCCGTGTTSHGPESTRGSLLKTSQRPRRITQGMRLSPDASILSSCQVRLQGRPDYRIGQSYLTTKETRISLVQTVPVGAFG